MKLKIPSLSRKKAGLSRTNALSTRARSAREKVSSVRGFTLIELLVVIAVIGALSSIVIVTFPAAQKRARDSQRKSDIKQYQTALESYANKNDGLYPGDDGDLTVNCGDFGLSGGACVDDPLAANPYQIQSSATDYVIWAQLEMPNSSSQTVYFVSCSTGVSGDDTSVPTDENCPL